MEILNYVEKINEKIENASNIFIMGHKYPDMDAIGASIGMALICKKNKKRCFIVVDDDLDITYYNVEWTRP